MGVDNSVVCIPSSLATNQATALGSPTQKVNKPNKNTINEQLDDKTNHFGFKHSKDSDLPGQPSSLISLCYVFNGLLRSKDTD